MNNNPTNIFSHTRRIMIEQIMALIGRGSSDPASYRRTLELFEIETLRRTLAELTGNFCGTNGDKTEEPLGCGAIQTTIAASGDADEIAARVSQGSPSSPALLLS